MPSDEATPWRIVELESEHIEGLRRMRNALNCRKWFRNSELISPDDQIAWFQRYKSDSFDHMWVALNERQSVVGAVAVYNIDRVSRSAEFGRLMIDVETMTGLGLGRILSEWALRQAASFGIQNLRLEVRVDNTRAISLYRHIGFREHSETEGFLTMLRRDAATQQSSSNSVSKSIGG